MVTMEPSGITGISKPKRHKFNPGTRAHFARKSYQDAS